MKLHREKTREWDCTYDAFFKNLTQQKKQANIDQRSDEIPETNKSNNTVSRHNTYQF